MTRNCHRSPNTKPYNLFLSDLVVKSESLARNDAGAGNTAGQVAVEVLALLDDTVVAGGASSNLLPDNVAVVAETELVGSVTNNSAVLRAGGASVSWRGRSGWAGRNRWSG
jgi:hypothetical protein